MSSTQIVSKKLYTVSKRSIREADTTISLVGTSATEIDGNNVDLQGWDSFLFLLDIGTTNTNASSIAFEISDDLTNWYTLLTSGYSTGIAEQLYYKDVRFNSSFDNAKVVVGQGFGRFSNQNEPFPVTMRYARARINSSPSSSFTDVTIKVLKMK